ncbi:trna pseudouridine synthase d [Cystoisospora suis]|uniref:Trna pseudouridine synthase d n=1 Tax=Cystoisospora suis TaxID=483139 RepID=A0A2C6LF10_9APIC|nr:trna pseudouridine synthase d [Cystoisospora suis]
MDAPCISLFSLPFTRPHYQRLIRFGSCSQDHSRRGQANMPSLRRLSLQGPRRDGCGEAGKGSNIVPPSSYFRRHRLKQEGRVLRFSTSICPPRSVRRRRVLDQPLFSLYRPFVSSLGRKPGFSLRSRSPVFSPFVNSSQDYTSASASTSRDFLEGMCTTAATSSSHQLLAYLPSCCHLYSHPIKPRSHRLLLRKEIKYHSLHFPLLYVSGISTSPCCSSSPHICCSYPSPDTISASSPPYLRPLRTPPTFHPFRESPFCSSRSAFFSSFAFSEWRTEPILHLRGVGKVSRPVILSTSLSSSSSSTAAPSLSPCKSNRRLIPSEKELIYPVQGKEQQKNSNHPGVYDVSSHLSVETSVSPVSRRGRLSSGKEESSLSSRLPMQGLHDKNTTAVSCESPPSHSRNDGERKRRNEVFFVSSGLYTEKEIGAGAFVSDPPCKGRMLDGIMRYRSEDFIVREIDEDGRLSTVFEKREANEGSSQESLFRGLEEIDRRRERLMKALENCRNEIQRRNNSLAHPSDHTAPIAVSCSSFPLPSSPSSSSALREVSEHRDELMKITLEALAKEAEALSSIKFVLVKLNKETPEALEVLAKATGIDVSRFSFAGMKDRRSITTQWISCSNPLILPADSTTITTATSSAVSSSSYLLPSGEEWEKGCESSPSGRARREKGMRRGSEEEQPEEEEETQMSKSTETASKSFYRYSELEERDMGDQSKKSLQTERKSSFSASSRLMARSRISSSASLPSFIPSSFSSAEDRETSSHHVLGKPSSSLSCEPLAACPHQRSDSSNALSASLHPGCATTVLPGERSPNHVNSCARTGKEGKGLNGEEAESRLSSMSITEKKGEISSPPSPVLLTAEVAREAILHPSWDSSGIYWGNFEVGKVYLGCLGGNHFSILLRNLQMTSLSDCSKGRCHEHTIPASENASSSCSSSLSVSTVFSSPVDSAHQQGRFPEERTHDNEREKKEKEEELLKEFMKEAAVSITRRGFINYFGPQRFGTGRRPSYHIGRALLHRQYRKVCNLIMMQPPLPPSLPSSLYQKRGESSERGDISMCEDQKNFLNTSQGQQHEEDPKRQRDAEPPGRKDDGDFDKAEIERDKRHEEKREVKKSESSDSMMMTKKGEGERHQEEKAEEIPFENSRTNSSLLNSDRKKNNISPSSFTYRLPSLIAQKKTQDIYRRYLLAQEAFWQGDFYRAFACLPRQCRQERQLLRSLLSSSSLPTASSSNGDLPPHQPFREGGAHTREGRDRQSLLDDDGDMEECLEALELAHASGGTNPSELISEHGETFIFSYSPLSSSSSSPSPWKDCNTSDLQKAKVLLTHPLSTVSFSADSSCSIERNSQKSCDTLIYEKDTDADDGEEGRERKTERGLGGARFARKEDVMKAVKSIPKLQRVLFVKAYSAYIWNRCATERIRLYGADAPVPGDLVLCHEGNEEKRLFTQGSTQKETNKESSSSSYFSAPHSLSRKGDVPSSPLTESSCKKTTERRKCGDPVVKVLKTKEECAKYSIADVVLPLIGVGMQFPENKVGDFLARLIQEEGLHERLYRREEDIFLDASYRPLLSFPRNFSCELLRLRLPLPQSSSSSMPKEEEKKKKEREGKADNFSSAPPPTETVSDAASPCTGDVHRKRFDEDQKSLLKVFDGEEERKKHHIKEKQILKREAGTKGEEQEKRKIKDEEERRRRKDSVEIHSSTSSGSCSDSRCRRREKKANTPERRSEEGRSRQMKKIEKEKEETEESWQVIWSSNTRSKTSEKKENTPEDELPSSVSSSPSSSLSPSSSRSSFALRLHFTLPPGVFASSLIREFTHSPFKHPFEQRLRENRRLPSNNRKTKENLLSLLLSASSSYPPQTSFLPSPKRHLSLRKDQPT